MECTEYRIGKATVRIHPGKLSDEERKEQVTAATIKYWKAVQKQRKKKEGVSVCSKN